MKIGLLTAFSEMRPAYSLAKVVRDQIRMIQDAGHRPILITLDDFDLTWKPDWATTGWPVEMRPILPAWEKRDYLSEQDLTEEHLSVMHQTATALMANQDIDVWFTHDILFQGWNMPLGLGMSDAAEIIGPRCRWLHWIHSMPHVPGKDFWRLPENSLLVYPNHTDRKRVAEAFRCSERDVAIVPHVCDARDGFQSSEALELANSLRLMDAEFITVCPIPIDRAEAKGIFDVIRILGALKQRGRSVRLVIADANYDETAHREIARQIRREARVAALAAGDWCFTHEIEGFEKAASVECVRDLMSIANLFIFPTRGETFGFTLAEAALSGQLLVLNSNLPMLAEVAGPEQLAVSFPSVIYDIQYGDGTLEDALEFYGKVADRIIGETDRNPIWQAKTSFRRRYHREAVWRKIVAAMANMQSLQAAA